MLTAQSSQRSAPKLNGAPISFGRCPFFLENLMAIFKKGPMTPDACNGKPNTGAQPKGGYGSAGAPSKAQKMGGKKGEGLRMKTKPNKPMGGFGTHGKPMEKKQQIRQPMGDYACDGMATPKTPIPKDQKTGRFNLPKGKFV